MNIFPVTPPTNPDQAGTAAVAESGTGATGTGLGAAFSFELALRELEAINLTGEQAQTVEVAAPTEESLFPSNVLAHSILAGIGQKAPVQEGDVQLTIETLDGERLIEELESETAIPQLALQATDDAEVVFNLQGQQANVPEAVATESLRQTEVAATVNQQLGIVSNQAVHAGDNSGGNPYQSQSPTIFDPDAVEAETDAGEAVESITQHLEPAVELAGSVEEIIPGQTVDAFNAPATTSEQPQDVVPVAQTETVADLQSRPLATPTTNEAVQTAVLDNHTAAIVESTAPRVTAQAVSGQVNQAIQTKFSSFTNEPKQSIQVNLHPPELGQLQITVEQTSDQMVAQIMATEFNSTELLLQEKDFLMEKLADLGFGEMSLDISHGESEQQEQSGDRPTGSVEHVEVAPQQVEQNLNIQIQNGGVNFVA